MKGLIPTLLLCVACAAPAVLRAADFEGKVRMKITSGQNPPHALDYAVKAGVLRTDLAGVKGHGGTMIMNFAKREMTILMPEQHMYMTQPLPGALPGAAAQAGAPEAADALTATGEKEKILGYDCTKYTVATKEGTTQLWLTEQLGGFTPFTPPGGPGAGRPSPVSAWAQALAGRNFFPLRVIVLTPAGQEQMRLEVESVQPQPLPDALFAPPADYQKLDMGGMMRGMGGLRR